MNESFKNLLHQALRESHSVNSIITSSIIGDDEMESITESILEETDLKEQVQTVVDFLGISEKDAQSILEKAHQGDTRDYDESSSSANHDDRDIQESMIDDNDSDNNGDGQYILDGECELCERDVKLQSII